MLPGTVCTRRNIARMNGNYTVRFQRTEGVDMTVYGIPKNASLPTVNLTVADDDTIVTIPDGGVGNFTFEYIIPPGFDDLSAAVVMDSGVRPPPPPSPPGPPGGSCSCPLLPLETNGGTATQCNSTYATVKLTLDGDDSGLVVYQCVPWPNYGGCGLAVWVKGLWVKGCACGRGLVVYWCVL